MGGGSVITPTRDIEKINSVLKHPDIWPLIADDSDNIETFKPPVGDNHYLFEDGILFILHPKGDDWEIHANVLPDHRGDAMKAASEALRYGFSNLGARRIVANIPKIYGNVYGFALKFMNDEGLVNDEHFLTLRAEQWVS